MTRCLRAPAEGRRDLPARDDGSVGAGGQVRSTMDAVPAVPGQSARGGDLYQVRDAETGAEGGDAIVFRTRGPVLG